MPDPWAGGPEPTGRIRFKEMLPTLVLDVVAVPILVFNRRAAGGPKPAGAQCRVQRELRKATKSAFCWCVNPMLNRWS
jgi:hypothetical protein